MDLLKLIKENPYVFAGSVVVILCIIGVSAWYFVSESSTSSTSSSQSSSSNSLSGNASSGSNASTGANSPVDCVVKYPDTFGPCDPVFGIKTATGVITTYPANGGKLCPSDLTVTAPCDDVDCVVTYPDTWGPCSPSGFKTATGIITTYPSGNGQECGPLTMTEPCPVDCIVNYGSPGPCDPVYGVQSSTGTIKRYALNGGKDCPPLTMTQKCPVDCVVDYPSTWGSCDPISGLKTATGTVRTYPMNGGATCPSLTMTEPCPVDCQVQWQNGVCNYNTGAITNQATIVTPSKNGGASCPTSLTSTTSCPKYLGTFMERNYPLHLIPPQGSVTTASQCKTSATNAGASLFALGLITNGNNSAVPTAVCYYNPNDNYTLPNGNVLHLNASNLGNASGGNLQQNTSSGIDVTGNDGWIYSNNNGFGVKAVYSA